MKTVPSCPEQTFQQWLSEWQQLNIADGVLKEWHTHSLYDANVKKLLHDVVIYSDYLAKLLLKFPDVLHRLLSSGADGCMMQLLGDTEVLIKEHNAQAEVMTYLRQLKAKASLCIALADIQGAWSLEQVTIALSRLADFSVEACLSCLLLQAARRQEIALNDANQPTRDCGIIVFGMGKLGAFELNYSSDIDLIVFFERGKLSYQGKHNEQKFFSKIAQDLMTMLQERTVDGYVFRTDLRLRPDPSSTPLAVSVEAALNYYEGVGQNWERAAMIKARPVAGDMRAGETLLKQLVPFVWRKNLDFATIQDILSIKRQINHKVGGDIQITGHNIKLGKGGIREIEFFVQLHQLIWGGRQMELRSRGTLETLASLVKLGHVELATATFLHDAYIFLRTLEHRLQMVADQQTHSMPTDEADIDAIASFIGEKSSETFRQKLTNILTRVHKIFVESFSSDGLASDEGNLVFTGTNHDPDTLSTLRSLGFDNAEVISETIMGWHHGSRRCTRTKRSRQLLTELVPTILNALGKTANPSAAFLKFDAFLADLPAGVQIFSLFSSNPHLLELIASIMGSAPTLSHTLSKHPELLESALFGDFYHTLPARGQMQAQLSQELEPIEYFDAAMERLRQFKHEKQFQAGVQLLKKLSSPGRVSEHLSALADLLLDASLKLVAREFEKQYGTIEGAGFAVVALGKLGSFELTFGSDIDLVFIYHTPDFNRVSSGQQAHSASVYYNRFAQRFINAMATMGENGQLFEIDTRLRPSGKQGLLAVSNQAFAHYFDELAWTFEHMALIKARVVATLGAAPMERMVEKTLHNILTKPRDRSSLARDVSDMRERVEREFGSEQMWDIKHAAGGLMDIDFTAQYITLGFAHHHPQLLKRQSGAILQQAMQISEMQGFESELQTLMDGNTFLIGLQHILRLSSEDATLLKDPPKGLAELLARYMDMADFGSLCAALEKVEHRVRKAYIHLIESYTSTDESE